MLGRLLRNVVQDPKWGQWGAGMDQYDMATNTGSGMRVTSQSSLQLLTVYGCVRLIAETISTMPMDQLRATPTGKQPVAVKAAWLDVPNVTTTRAELLYQVTTSLLLDGNAFLVPTRNALGQVVELWVLNPLTVDVRAVNGATVYAVKGRPFLGEMRHLRGFLQAGEVRGMNAIENARQAVGLGMAVSEYGARFFGNGTSLSGVIEHPGTPDKEQVQIMRTSWGKHHQGVNKAHLPGIVTGGAKWVPISITAEQAQFLATRNFQAAEITSFLFGIDPPMMGVEAGRGDSIVYQNLETRWIEFVRRACMPWMSRIETLFSSLLPGQQYVKLNADAYLRPDTTVRYASYAVGLENHFLTNPEVREMEDRPPIPGEPLFPPAKTPTPPTPPTGGPNA